MCTCHQVRQAVIQKAISSGCCSVEAIGQCTRAGTQCGSCVPELRKLIQNVEHSIGQKTETSDIRIVANNLMQEENVC
ncbi:MAG: (2Fe-2S)-binding protein [Pseudohongiella sp.]|nr:(2Fe-2S)-binding protein [Pseudohongiella sp.]